MIPGISLEEWRPGPDPSPTLRRELDEFARLLHAVVQDGACVNFILPFSVDDARAFWEDKVLPPARLGKRRVLIARRGASIVGTVQLNIDMPPNQTHRADVMKLLVDPRAQRQGLGRQLMTAVEDLARSENRTLLTLDTRSGDKGEQLYLSMGFVPLGIIPGYSRSPISDDLEDCTFFFKQLI